MKIIASLLERILLQQTFMFQYSHQEYSMVLSRLCNFRILADSSWLYLVGFRLLIYDFDEEKFYLFSLQKDQGYKYCMKYLNLFPLEITSNYLKFWCRPQTNVTFFIYIACFVISQNVSLLLFSRTFYYSEEYFIIKNILFF